MSHGEHDADVLDPAGVLPLVEAALTRREALLADPGQTALRLFHGYGEGVPGLEIDRFGQALVVTHHHEHTALLEPVLDLLSERGCALGCVVARTRKGRVPPRLLRGALPKEPLVVLDNGLRFEVDPLSPGSAGLYLDARPARAWIRAQAAGRRTLNLFAYTGSLGLAAAAGGAPGVVHVELQKRALRRLKSNYRLNDLCIDDRDLVRADLYPYLRREARRGSRFEAIILDPPPQVPGRAPGQDYAGLVPLAADVLAPGGWLLCFFSRYGRPREVYEQEVLAACPYALEVIWRGTSGLDFPEADPESKLRFSAFRRAGSESGGAG